MPCADLIAAVQADDVPALRAAVAACSRAEELNEPDGDGICAFLGASLRGHVECMKMLVDAGCDAAAKSPGGQNALMAAAHSGVPAALRMAMEAEWCELDAKSSSGETAFLIACRMGHTEIMEMLVDKGCDTEVTCSQGRNALMAAAYSGVLAALRMAMQAEWCELDARDDNSVTAFLVAANQGHADSMQMLADAGCDTAAAGALGSALSNAVVSHVPAAVRLALDKGWGELEARNDDTFTVFLRACLEGHTEIMEMLFDVGCDASAKLSDGTTAMDLAKEQAERDNDDTLVNRLRELLHERNTQQKIAALKQEAHELMEYDRFAHAAALLTQALRLKPGGEELQALREEAKARAAEQLEERQRRAAKAEAELMAMVEEEKAGKQNSKKKQEKMKINQSDKETSKQMEEMKSAEAEKKKKTKREKRVRQRQKQRVAKLATAEVQGVSDAENAKAETKQADKETAEEELPGEMMSSAEAEEKQQRKREKRARQKQRQRAAKLAATPHEQHEEHEEHDKPDTEALDSHEHEPTDGHPTEPEPEPLSGCDELERLMALQLEPETIRQINQLPEGEVADEHFIAVPVEGNSQSKPASGSQLSPEEEEQYWTRLAAMKTKFEPFATACINRLAACVSHGMRCFFSLSALMSGLVWAQVQAAGH